MKTKPLERLIGERIEIDSCRYEIAGFNIADQEVRVRVVALDGRHERIEVTFDRVLDGLFGSNARK